MIGFTPWKDRVAEFNGEVISGYLFLKEVKKRTAILRRFAENLTDYCSKKMN